MARKPKPDLAVWLIAHRKEHGESVEDIARVTDRSAATVRGWEAGRPPSVDDPVIAHLERHWGSVAPTDREPDQSDVAAAIRENTAMLERVLQAFTDRLAGAPSYVLAELADAELQAEMDRRRTTTPRRSSGPADPDAARGTDRPRARTGE